MWLYRASIGCRAERVVRGVVVSTPIHHEGQPYRPARQLDLAPLTRPLDHQQIDAFIADSKATGKPWRVLTTGLPRPGVGDIISQLIPVVIPLAGLLFIVGTGGWSLISSVWSFTLEAPFPLNLVIVGVVALILLGVLLALFRVVSVIRSMIIPRWWWETAYRLVGFAGANNLRYGHDESAAYPGVIFETGTDRIVERRLSTTSGRHVEIGNYRYVERGSDNDNVSVYGWGYVAITLDRRLPHLLLDAVANNRSVFGIKSSNLPVDLATDQRLTLGREFDDRFNLYAPSEYGRDAFQIFAPDLMALFIDRLGTFDVEIVDDTMFCYGSRFDLLNPATYEWLQELVETVVARTVRRTARYRDDFALLESDPVNRPAASIPMGYEEPVQSPSEPSGSSTGFQLFPGFVLGPGGAGALGPADVPPAPAPAAPSNPTQEPVFAFAGDGPPQTATNLVAEKGRRLRRRRWGFWSVVGLLVIGFYVYNEVVAPIFGLPHLGR